VNGREEQGLRRFDEEWMTGAQDVAVGVDEVGRGCIAGPVVAAAVALGGSFAGEGLRDSKQLTAPRREMWAARIRSDAMGWAVSYVGPREIDRLDIRRATLLAMGRAVRRLERKLGATARLRVLVDGSDRIPGLAAFQTAIIGGDGRSACIAAASIVAKTSRDAFMTRIATAHPEYGFERNKGYGTEQHVRALQRHGPSCWHRFSFSPVAQRDLFAAEESASG